MKHFCPLNQNFIEMRTLFFRTAMHLRRSSAFDGFKNVTAADRRPFHLLKNTFGSCVLLEGDSRVQAVTLVNKK